MPTPTVRVTHRVVGVGGAESRLLGKEVNDSLSSAAMRMPQEKIQAGSNEALRKTMADYHDLVDNGRREILRLES